MAEKKISQNEVINLLKQQLGASQKAPLPALEKFAQKLDKRSNRLGNAEARLKERLGEDHPQVIALQKSQVKVSAMQSVVQGSVSRLKKVPKLRSYEWMVRGNIVDSQGKPLKGLLVKVFDKDRKYDDLIGEAKTDEHGDFAIIYHQRDFMEKGEAEPDMYVVVTTARGKKLYSSEAYVRFNAGRTEYFEIVLEK